MSSITQAGSQLLAQALAWNKLVFTGARLVETLYSDGDLASMTALPSSGSDLTGAVKRVMYSDGQCLATAVFANSQSGTYKTAVIMAKLANQSDGEAVPFCGFNESDIYSPSGMSAFIDVDFTITFIQDASVVQIIEGDAATPEYVDDLRADVFNHGGLCRVYPDFVKAQCYAADGESAFVDPHAPNVMYIGNKPYQGVTATTHAIVDICDHIMAVLLTDANKTYINCFDLRDATFEHGKLYLPQPFVYSSLGDENSTKARVGIIKIDGLYFALAFTDSSSTNLWWYNSAFGQDSGSKAVGRCAVMALDNCSVPASGGGMQTLARGHWYYIADSTIAAMRGMGKDLALFTSSITNDSADVSLVRLALSYHTSNGRAILFATSSLYNFGTALLDPILSNGAQTFVELCEATKMGDDVELVLISKCDMNYGLARTGAGCMISDSYVQGISSTAQINASFWSGYDLDNGTITAIANGMYIEGTFDYARLYKTCAGLWFDTAGAWVKFKSALQTALVYDSENSYDSHTANTMFLNGHVLQVISSGASTRLIWGMNDMMVCSTFTGISGDIAMLAGMNVCTGIGLIASWKQTNMNDLWLAYVPPKHSTDAGWQPCVKVDGRI